MTDRIAIIGSSGLGREVRDVCVALGMRELCFLDRGVTTSEFDGLPIYEDTPEIVARLCADNWRLIIAIAQPHVRKAIAERYGAYPFATVAHPSATFGVGQRERFERSHGSSACAGARFTNNITIGNHTIINLNATVGHDTILGDFASIMPSANISGNVELKRAVYIGTGAVIINGGNDRFLVIGEGATIGAGAVVVGDVPAGATYVGVPARPIAGRG